MLWKPHTHRHNMTHQRFWVKIQITEKRRSDFFSHITQSRTVSINWPLNSYRLEPVMFYKRDLIVKMLISTSLTGSTFMFNQLTSSCNFNLLPTPHFFLLFSSGSPLAFKNLISACGDYDARCDQSWWGVRSDPLRYTRMLAHIPKTCGSSTGPDPSKPTGVLSRVLFWEKEWTSEDLYFYTRAYYCEANSLLTIESSSISVTI